LITKGWSGAVKSSPGAIQVVGIVGPSGSGKSTLLHVMAGLFEPSGGAVLVDGQDITRLTAAERATQRRTTVGVVLQRDNLHPLLTAAENVALPLRMQRKPRLTVAARVAQLLAGVGLSDHARRRVGQLSGGEQQRIAIAVALAPEPRVLLADEPTGELDERTADGVLTVLDTLRGRDGTTVLTVTHNAQVADRADRHVVMRDGVIADAA